jgi:hypothetical protein
MTRKKFIQGFGATCNNWQNSWSFVNHVERFVIFGAWDIHTTGNSSELIAESWATKANGHKHGSYDQSREHIRLIEEDGYDLKIYKMKHSDELHDEDGNGPAKIESWEPVLYSAKLEPAVGRWVAVRGEVFERSEFERRVTEKDFIFAELIFPILVEHVNRYLSGEVGSTLTYDDVVRSVKLAHPDVEAVKTFHPRMVGRRLGTIWMFTRDKGCPHIGSLVVNKHTGECGSGITKILDPEAERKKVFEYNGWGELVTDFSLFLDRTKITSATVGKKLKPKKFDEAKELFFEHYSEELDELPVAQKDLAPYRNEFISLVEQGYTPEIALSKVLSNLLATNKVKPIEKKNGFLYIGHYVECETNEPILSQIKVGYTNRSVEDRAKELSGGVKSPIGFQVIMHWEMEPCYAYIAEQEIHGTFKDHCSVGEFYHDADSWLMDEIESHVTNHFGGRVCDLVFHEYELEPVAV